MTTDRQSRGCMVTPTGNSAPLTVTWLWAPEKPFDVRVGWHLDGTTEVAWWTVPRDVLLRSLTQDHAELTACDGLVEFAALRVVDTLVVDLANEWERSRMITDVEPLRDLLCEAYLRVPAGQEPVDVDAAVAKILEAAS